MNDHLNRLEPPRKNPDLSMWVDEAIWGHRLHDEQTPWLVYLEFLNVFCYEDSEGRVFEESGYNTLKYCPAKRLYLRNILFNNPWMEEILRKHPNDLERWQEWLDKMSETETLNAPDFSYVKEHFSSFEHFYQVVSLLRTTSLENGSNKRWTSRFVFPYSEVSLYEDLDKKCSTNDRRFFGRTGEMLYLMLCRSKYKKELAVKIKEKTLNSYSVWHTLIKCLQPSTDENKDRSERANAFVPYTNHRSFDLLAEDWLAILSLSLPDYDALPYLVNLVGLHIIQYQLTVAAQVAKRRQPYFICEIVAPKKTLVRELSCETFHSNDLLSAQAVDIYISNIREMKEWQEAVGNHDPYSACREILQREFLWLRDASDYNGPADPGRLLDEFRSTALNRHRGHVGNVHRVYGREIGLVSRRGTNKYRYAPTDDFLRTLIFANVEKRMELHFFLERLLERYGMVLGDKEGEKVLDRKDFDKKSFKANSQRLEQRLVSLGLLQRLSDGCAYVKNPYFSRSDNEK